MLKIGVKLTKNTMKKSLKIIKNLVKFTKILEKRKTFIKSNEKMLKNK